MTDLHTRFRTLDDLSAPNLWNDIEERAMAMQPARRSGTWVLIVVTLLLALAIGAAVLVGSGVIKLPVIVDASMSPSSAPSSSAQASTAPSASPLEPVQASWTASGDMVEARTNHTATQLLDGRVLVAGGVGVQQSEGLANILASAELYDPNTGAWTATGAMSQLRGLQTATLLPDGKVLVVGGSACADFDGCPLTSAELYDPASGTWIATGSMVEARLGDHTATLLNNGKVLVAGGTGGAFESMRSAELYDPATGSWSSAGQMVEPRSNHTATLLLDGKVLVAGSGTEVASAELYDPSTGQWTATGTMSGLWIHHTATRLPDGKVLAAGGGVATDQSGTMTALYDPSTGQWTAAGTMVEGRIYHTATLLPDGTVLVVGGANSVIDPAALATAEIYDAISGSWVATTSMAEARHSYTATLLPDGTVLVVGGTGGGGTILASTERFDPGSGG